MTSHPHAPRWERFAAIGDSFTEGLWDHDGDPEELHGWADRLASTLSERRVDAGLEPLRYANLAIRGRRMQRILHEQLDEALELGPDLVSIVGGGIDVLRLASDPDMLAQHLEAAVVRARAAGADVLLATCMDTRTAGLLLSAVRGRMALYNAHIWTIARLHGAFVLDQWGLRALADRRMWAHDRIHLSPEGHHRLSQGALAALGLALDDPRYLDLLPRAPRTTWQDRVRDDAAWLRRDVGPWALRGLRGRSTGDGRSAKRPELVPVVPGHGAATSVSG